MYIFSLDFIIQIKIYKFRRRFGRSTIARNVFKEDNRTRKNNLIIININPISRRVRIIAKKDTREC